MPEISDADFAAFQKWKSSGGAGAPAATASSWQPPGGAGLPPPTGTPGQYGGQDYTAQNAEISRRALAAQHDPNSPTYISPEQRAKFANAQQMQAQANPGWTWNGEAGGTGYWTADAAHNNAAGSAAFANSWQALGKANPEAFDVPTDAQGRPIDARTGQPMPGGTTAAQRAQPQGAPQWQPPPGAPPAGNDWRQRSPDEIRQEAISGGASPADADARVQQFNQARTQQAPQPTAPQWQPPGYGRGYSPTATMQPAPSSSAPPAGTPPPNKVWDPQKGWVTPGASPGGTY